MVKAEYLLLKAGYKRLGDGYFAKVYGRADADHVLKLFKSRDTAYMAFVNMVMKNPNPHFPAFKGKMMKVTNDYYAIRMERLTPLPDNTPLGPSFLLAAHMLKYILMVSGDEDYQDEVYADFMEKLEDTQPGITQACDLIGNKLLPTYLLDLHSANIMQRDNVIVITDPVS